MGFIQSAFKKIFSGLVQYEIGRVWGNALQLRKTDTDFRGGLWGYKIKDHNRCKQKEIRSLQFPSLYL